MPLPPNFPASPHAILYPNARWVPDEPDSRMEKLPPLVQKLREQVKVWRDKNHEGATDTSRSLLHWWFREEHLLTFEFEMGLFPAIMDEAKSKGIALEMKYIPAEVFDKRAVEKNQVVFHDVSFIEVKTHVTHPPDKGGKGGYIPYDNSLTPKARENRKNPTTNEEILNNLAGVFDDLQKRLAERKPPKSPLSGGLARVADFSGHHSQDSIAGAEESVKNSKSKIVVDNGRIVRVGKDKNGKITCEPLTKHWTDWIDYWAVDFYFESKREIIRVRNEDTGETEEQWSGDYIFENEWQSFRTKKDRSLELTSAAHECPPGWRKMAVKVVDIFGNDTMKIVEVGV